MNFKGIFSEFGDTLISVFNLIQWGVVALMKSPMAWGVAILFLVGGKALKVGKILDIKL